MEKYNKIKDQIWQYSQEKKHLDRYLANCLYIALGWEAGFIDYKTISHGNKLLNHGFGRMLGTTNILEPLESRLQRQK